MEGELHKESIFCDAQLLTTHTLSAKGPTRNCDLDGLVLLTEVKIVGRTMLLSSYLGGYYKELQKW